MAIMRKSNNIHLSPLRRLAASGARWSRMDTWMSSGDQRAGELLLLPATAHSPGGGKPA